MMCSFEPPREQWYRGPVLPYIMLGHHKVKWAVKSKLKGKPCFHLKPGSDHASGCCKIMLSPSGAASYSTNVT